MQRFFMQPFMHDAGASANQQRPPLVVTGQDPTLRSANLDGEKCLDIISLLQKPVVAVKLLLVNAEEKNIHFKCFKVFLMYR